MSAPRWAMWLLRKVAPPERADDVVGDLEEAHRTRVERRGAIMATLLTGLEAMDVARAFLVDSLRDRTSVMSLLELKLAVRMLVRYPGLTVVAGVSMAFAIWASASVFEFFHQILRPSLGLDEGARIVTIRAWDPASNREEARLAPELFAWTGGARSVDDLGAYRSLGRTLVVGNAAYPLSVADISPSAFQLTRVAPLHGRFLVEDDARSDGPAVVVLGFGLWQRHFGADPSIVGRTIRLGAEEATVVGVMPGGYAFPVSHEAWTALRLDTPADGERGGPPLQVFARLARDATIDEARVELSGIAVRTTAASPAAPRALRFDVVRYGSTALGVDLNAAIAAGMAGLSLLPVLLLLLISSTVALLMFARAAAREGELSMRMALGASRRRIVGQLFVEALVLGGLAAVVGLAATGMGLRWLMGMAQAEVFNGAPLPFWMRDRVSAATVVYAAVLVVLGAFVSGAGPALKLTRGLGARLKQATPGGGGVKLGGVWTAVVVVQVAFTVVFPTVGVAVFREGMAMRNYEIAIADEEFLAIRVQMDRQAAAGEAADTSLAVFRAEYETAFLEVVERLEEDPAVRGVTFAERLPRTYHPWNQIEVDVGAVAVEDPRGHRVGRAAVDVDYFDVLGAPVLQGRGFTLADLDTGASVVIVDQPFVERVLGGGNPIGRRIRYLAGEGRPARPAEDAPWYEIVGVAADLGVRCGWGYGGIYHPTRPGPSYPLQLVIQMRSDPEAFVSRVRAVATAVDPRIRLLDPLPLAESTRISEDAFYDFWITLALIVSWLALLISLSAIYSVTSFTVVRRTREIGVRVALGGASPRVLGAVLRRPLSQVAGGIALGLVLTWMLQGLSGEGGGFLMLAAYGVVMSAVCATACMVPTRRALAIEPTEALRADG